MTTIFPVTPLMNWLRRCGVPLWPAFIIVAVLVVAFILMLVGIVYVSINQFSDSLPEYRDRIADLKQGLEERLESIGIDIQSVLSLHSFQPDSLIDFQISFMKQVAAGLSSWGLTVR